MELKGTLDGFPAEFLYRSNGFEFIDIKVKLGEVIFEWDQLSPLQQVQVLQQLDSAFPIVEKNYN
jgi:hypothetical protein